MEIQRVWAMPSAETFSIKPIRQLVKSYLATSVISIDPFARNNRWTTYTNDLNPDTQAEYHLEAKEFLQMLVNKQIEADLVLFDPPYSRRQVMECYQGIGRDFQNSDSLAFTTNWRDERNLINNILVSSGIVISFGWHSNGMCEGRGFSIEEILLVAHGGAHHDTICTVERKVKKQVGLFEENIKFSNIESALLA